MNQSDLEREVRTIIRERIDKGLLTNPDWVTDAVVSGHKEISGNDKDWYRLCAYAHIRGVARKVVQMYKAGPQSEIAEQLIMDGFRYLQRAYLVERRKKQTVIPTDRLTSAEIAAKIQELRAMGQGCFEHADELSNYLQERRATA
jgi:hypothetical protein